MKIKEILTEYCGAPIEKSIGPVSQALATSPVLIAVKSATPDDLQFQVASDKQGSFWIYAFSDEAEYSKAFPSGGAFVEMHFGNVLETIGPDNRFGGIFINSKSDAQYVIPRQIFGNVYQLMQPH